MKCGDARIFLSQITGPPITMQVPQSDLDFLASNGYLSKMPKDEYDRAYADVATLTQTTLELQREQDDVATMAPAVADEERKTQGFMFRLQSGERKQAVLAQLQSDEQALAKERDDVVQKENRITELIQKKSLIDRMVQYDGQYLSLNGPGVMMLHDLNIRNYRVSDNQLSDFIQESQETYNELHSIAERGYFHVSSLQMQYFQFVQDDYPPDIWGVAIGLAKLQGDQYKTIARFLEALTALKHFDSAIQNKLMAAEIMTSFSDNPDVQGLTQSLKSLDDYVRHHVHVPKEQSAGVAATLLSGRRYDGTYPTDRFTEFSKMTLSNDSAAILSVLNVPTDQLANEFQGFRSLFHSWGYETSEDTELSSAYLAVSDFTPDDVKTKLVILLEALHNYLEYPIVAASILASVPTLEANETLDLMEKAFSLLQPYASSLERSELVSLAVRMIHGIKNELVSELDPTAKITKTPVQFTYMPRYSFFVFNRPLIVTHSAYHTAFSGFAGAHPGHGHGVGGFGG